MKLLTPWRNVRANTALQTLWPSRQYAGWWTIDGEWYSLQDHVRSNTVKVAYEEIQRGYYKPLVSIRPRDFLLDIGAHVGTWCIPMERKHPWANVIAYEPDQDNYANLQRNVERNHSGVATVCAGLWRDGVELVSHVNHKNTGGNVSRPGKGKGVHVKGYGLKSILRNWNIDRVRVLKMDCEGAEFNLERDDFNHVDSLLIEIHGDKGNARKLLATIEDSGIPYIAQVIHASGVQRLHSRPQQAFKSLSRPIPYRAL